MIERLRSALGSDAVWEADAGIRLHGAAPAAVVAPADVEQAVAAIRICAEHGWTALPAGAATWLHAGFARPADVLLSSARLRGIIEYEPADLGVAVHAGTPLSELDEAVRSHAQFFPVQPAALTGATVGGTIATASAGPLRLGYGTPRDHVLGLQIVTGDGRCLDLGGQVVKNVAGYDLVRLMVGSHGSLGFITRAFLRLRSRPARDMTAVFHAPVPASLNRIAGVIMDTWPVAVELLAPPTAALLLPGSGWALAVRWHGNASYAEYVQRRLDSATPPSEVIDGDAATDFWNGLALLEAKQTAAVHLATKPDLLSTALEAAQSLTGHSIMQSDNMLDLDSDARWQLAAHARSGIVRIWTDGETGLDRESLRNRLAAVRQHVTGSITIRTRVFPAAYTDAVPPAADPDHGTPGAGTGSGTVKGADGETDRVRALMRGIRHAFDPWRVFTPDPNVEPA